MTHSADLPHRDPPSRPWAMLMAIGPGIVVSGSVIGSGELINTPIQAATFGFLLLWAVILSCVIKVFLQIEIGRHALVHGRTTIEALNTCPGPRWRGTSWIGLLYMLGYAGSLATFIGILGAIAGLMHSLWPLAASSTSSESLWAIIVFAATLLILWRGFYGELEKLVTFLVFGFSISVVASLLLIQGSSLRITSEQLLSGVRFSLGEDNRQLAAFAVISLMGALGTTANELFMYPYWVLEKGYATHVGPRDAPGWLDRVRGWVRILQVDTVTCTFLATVLTASYFLLGASVLHGPGKEAPRGMAVVEQLSAMFTETYGRWSYGLFMFGAFCTLYSTLVVATAATGRMCADVVTSLKLADPQDVRVRNRLHRIFQSVFLVICLATVLGLRQPPDRLVMFGQYVNGVFNTPLLIFGICWMAFKTDRRIRMNTAMAVLLLASSLVIIACLAISLLSQSGSGH